MAKKGVKKQGQEPPAASAMAFVHSGCHTAHWELEYHGNGRYSLSCEVCGKPAGGFKIEGPRLEGRGCVECGNGKKDDA